LEIKLSRGKGPLDNLISNPSLLIT
jgi:hypothetical protein